MFVRLVVVRNNEHRDIYRSSDTHLLLDNDDMHQLQSHLVLSDAVSYHDEALGWYLVLLLLLHYSMVVLLPCKYYYYVENGLQVARDNSYSFLYLYNRVMLS